MKWQINIEILTILISVKRIIIFKQFTYLTIQQADIIQGYGSKSHALTTVN